MIDVYLGLGSNQQPRYHLRSCLAHLEQKFGRIHWSPIYISPAVGFEGDDFFNMAVRIESNLTVGDLHQWLRELEDRHGRDRSLPKFSDRTLDVDLLLYGERIQTSGVVLPRPEITRYAHVLKPLADLAPELEHPVERKTLQLLWQEFKAGRQVSLTPTTI